MIERTTGKVYLLGAGPGDPDLLTVKARHVIERADVVLYDALVNEAILDVAPISAETIDVGKRPTGGTRTTQAEINDLMVYHARRGATVARVKGGDPTVYGRGGEEAQHLASESIPFELVPGVSSVTAAPGVVGIPLTHRERSSSVTIITGHEAVKEESALDWNALAQMLGSGGTLVVLMGVRTLPRTVERLRDAGIEADTPVAMIERATWQDERTVAGTVATIHDIAQAHGIESPAVTIFGDVVPVREEIRAYLSRGAQTAPETRSMSSFEEDASVPVSQR